MVRWLWLLRASLSHDARFINHDTNTADKCTFCAHRLDAGLPRPSKPVGEARVIGDLNDPTAR